ncbi:RNA-binding protein 26 isoform X2 [Anthonomus grandis grandis]|uniref:RNA-binding protein 26 isoform X2 n=1 Tax=Anthonomus grandis grandis TaxID=2921223 RepID=UPI0021652EB0|nr:RNA-binding protein 26 isoform X2 [Anthonomus grandis grandis]
MIVEQIEAFKSWLTAVLKPMCEADPAALAKYVLALVKKDKSEAELRKSMVGQLEVFLEGETETFVNLVFQTLATKGYIQTPSVIPNANPPNPNVLGKPKENKETKLIVQPSELPNLSEVVNGATPLEKKDPVKKDVKSRRNSENGEKEERPPRRRSRHRSLSRNRSRSRSWDKAKRSRSREKSKDRVEREHRVDRDKRDRLERLERDRIRPWRNKSPGNRRYDRRRSRSPRSPSPPRIRSRSRSPRHSHRSRYRNSRSRSRSLEKREWKDSKDGKTQSSGSGTPTQQENHAEGEALPNPNVASSVTVPANSSKRRCRDFDEKGYCMRGEMCPYDHGVDPVVLEDSTLTRVLSYDPNSEVAGAIAAGAPITSVPPPPGTTIVPPRLPDNPYNPQAPQMWAGGRFTGPRPMGGVRLPGINPFVPQPPAPMGIQRELIPVPVVMDQTKPPGIMGPGTYPPISGPPYGHPGTAPPQNYGPASHHGLEGVMHPGMYKKKFDYNRLGPRKNPGNCSLELKKVPVGMNTITHLNNHFAKFGKIVNIQVQYEGDPEAALITFSSHAEANSAYRSTEAVLNNRFIKLFWHDSDGGKQENVPPSQQGVLKDRVPGTVAPNSNKVLNLVQPKAGEPDSEAKPDDTEKPELSKEETKAQATAAIQKNQDLLAAQVKMSKNKDEQRKEVLKIQSDLRKKKQELLDKQLSQQKVLIEKMSKLPAGPQRDLIKETIKKTQEAIEGIKKDLEKAALAAKNAVLGRKSKEETQKELLDMELDLIAKQQEGADTTELQKKVAELKARAAMSTRGTIRGRGRGRFTPVVSRHLLSKNNLVDHNMKLTGKIKTANKIVNNPPTVATAAIPTVPVQPAVTFQKHTTDYRPTRLLISGYETDEQEGVLGHFQQFGEIVDYTIDTSLPSISLNYKTKKDAESALLKGKHFQDRTLSITWQSGNAHRLQTQRSGGSSTRTVLLSESEEDHLIDHSLVEGGDEELCPETEEALLQDDEDEDEEDRSWRR